MEGHTNRPQDDADQAIRLRRFGIAAVSYLMWVLLVIFCYLRGLYHVTPGLLALYFLLVGLSNGVFFVIFHTGANKRFRDPSLTLPQMIMGLFFALLAIYHTGAARGIMLMVFLVVFIFGVFRLRAHQFLGLTAMVLSIYGAMIMFQTRLRPMPIDPVIEWLSWIMLGAVLIWFSMVGGHINKLRACLTKSNAELTRAMDTIEQLAIRDDLTQVYNRRHIFTIMQHAKALADRRNTAFCICMLDLDHFKEVNDAYGHQKGDVVLKTIAQTIQANIRDMDHMGRYGGEEFILVLTSPKVEDARVCVERIRQVCAQLTYPGLPETCRVTVSAGVALYRWNESLDQLIYRADDAVYRAKAQGRNTVVFQPELDVLAEG